MDDVAKEGCPKFNPRPGWGLNPGPHGWQSEILPTVLTLVRGGGGGGGGKRRRKEEEEKGGGKRRKRK